MLPPVVCFQCGVPLRWSEYKRLCRDLGVPGEALRLMGVSRDCCRSHFLSHSDSVAVVFEPPETAYYGRVETGRTSASFITPQ